ncbi:VIT family protein [bacterium]|nr:VIT family protein [bacterium]
MSKTWPHRERHTVDRTNWLRAAVLGANDGVVSTASLIIGVAAAGAARGEILLTGVAGLVAGAMSMAAGEYVSVSSQADTESADLARETRELDEDPAGELRELAGFYVKRGLTPDLARQVAAQLTEHDALGAHAREELNIVEITQARPVQAALTSAATFSSGAAMAILPAIIAPLHLIPPLVAGCGLVALAGLGAASARVGRAPMLRPVLRVTLWGALAMAVTAAVGMLFGAVG